VSTDPLHLDFVDGGPSPARAKGILKGRVLLVDDDPLILSLFGRVLRGAGYAVQELDDARCVADMLTRQRFDVVLTDLIMPGMDGIGVLKAIRAVHPEVPVVLLTGQGSFDSAVKAVEFGALRYLTKPVDLDTLVKVVDQASEVHHAAQTRELALQYYNQLAARENAREHLNAALDRALATLYMVYQPIVRWSDKSIFGYEALVRTTEDVLEAPPDLLGAAEALNRLPEVGRTIRRTVAETLSASELPQPVLVNIHPRDLDDDELFSPGSPLAKMAGRVILEVTERAALDSSPEMQCRMESLRLAGYRIAVDDLGAGYSGLTSLAELHPNVVKLDICLTRGVSRDATKRKLVEMMVGLCKELQMALIAEGVETVEDRDALIEAGCDLLQGYLFGMAGPAFPPVDWTAGWRAHSAADETESCLVVAERLRA
jgi:EAL domain-containing protein (putative c-di-GMP-specific phosphodiesterase class I)